MLDCPLCAHAVDGMENAAAAGQLEQELSEVGALSSRAGQASNRNVWINWAAAAALVVLGLFGVLQYNAATVNERLFVEYFSAAQPNYLTLRSAQSADALAGKKELRKALEFYRAGAYEASLPHFSLHLESYPEDNWAYFLMANALLGARQGERAANLLRQLKASPPTGLAEDEIQWYLSLALLEQGETAAALDLLQRLSASAYEDQARQLREDLQ